MYEFKVFLSYSHRDTDFVQRVLVTLERLLPFVDRWIDVEGIRATDIWPQKIEDALHSCQLLLLTISPDALRSEYVKQEYTTFLTTGKPILPLYYVECPLPEVLSVIQYIDCRQQSPDELLMIPTEVSEKIIATVQQKRFDWLKQLLESVPNRNQQFAWLQQLVNDRDPLALSLLTERFEQDFLSTGDETAAAWYVTFIKHIHDPQKTALLEQLKKKYDSVEYPRLRLAFEQL